MHQNLARRKVLVVGAGSVGLDVAVRLAASGLVPAGGLIGPAAGGTLRAAWRPS